MSKKLLLFSWINFVVATVLFILILGFKVDEKSLIRFFYYAYIAISWVFPAYCVRREKNQDEEDKDYFARVKDQILPSVLLTCAIVTAYNVITALLGTMQVTRICGSVLIVAIMGVIALFYLRRARIK